MKRIALFVAVLACAGTAQAETFELNATGNAVHVSLGGNMGRVSEGSHGEYELGGLFHAQSGRDFNEGYLGLKIAGDLGVPGADVTGALGLRGYYVDGNNGNGPAVALGASVEGRVPRYNRVVWNVYGYYAPDPLAFADVHEYEEFGLSIGYEVVHRAVLFAGYRTVAVDFTGDGSHTVDNGLLGGVRLSF